MSSDSQSVRARVVLAAMLLALLAGCAGRQAAGPPDLQWLQGARPTYPARAKADGVEGEVVVEYRVTASGSVEDLHVVSSTPPRVFDAAALAAVRTWKYKPYAPDGTAVPVDGVRSTLTFKLGEAYEGL